MNCKEFLDSFSDHEDGLLSGPDLEAFEGHRDACPSCRRYVEVVHRGRALLASLPPAEVGEDFTPRLEHRIHHLVDGTPLPRDRDASSGTTAVTVLAIAVLMALAAWSPSVRRPLVVELPAIVVDQPPPRPAQLRYRTPTLGVPASEPYFRTLWTDADRVLFDTSPLGQRYRQAALSRAGLE